ncbi:hypothetical protein [Chromatium okenii]|jgi:hypothetical protein|uniref:hypothetical protein n=1 Tax=Chromatium okenii TaxID=61644 RepID=UPI0026E98A07|nr:hypothetical protein [Chromatium okenii]MBV5310863.1 hypothetical protein [Chromatium okenii]
MDEFTHKEHAAPETIQTGILGCTVVDRLINGRLVKIILINQENVNITGIATAISQFDTTPTFIVKDYALCRISMAVQKTGRELRRERRSKTNNKKTPLKTKYYGKSHKNRK